MVLVLTHMVEVLVVVQFLEVGVRLEDAEQVMPVSPRRARKYQLSLLTIPVTAWTGSKVNVQVTGDLLGDIAALDNADGQRLSMINELNF